MPTTNSFLFCSSFSLQVYHDANTTDNLHYFLWFSCTVAPPPTNLTVTLLGGSSDTFTVMWTAAYPTNLNGNILRYILRYRRVAPDVETTYTLEEITVTDVNAQFTLEDLPGNSVYSVEVCQSIHMGTFLWTEDA